MSKKAAYVSVSYTFTFYPKNVGLDENCSEEQFQNAVDAIMDKKINLIAEQADIIPDEIETEILTN